ncbi:MAG: class I SAM-dependent methyltransferase, partial [Atopostipes suicloacalis]|nr:class I SAM-dependent methyltransferase [Atopostipes suicloacalis]
METNDSKLFEIFDESTKIIVEALNISYLEGLIHSVENLMDKGQVYNEEKNLSENTVEKLKNLYKNIDLTNYNRESLANAMQLTLLKAMKEDYIQSNHQMTPDSIGNLMAYLIEVIVEPTEKIHLADLSVGTANLLLTVYHFLNQDKKREIELSGIDNDELMIAAASTNSAIQNTKIYLQYQDSLSNILLNPVDIMISDLPIGYYPLEDRAKKFQTHFPKENQKSYSHYLLIEQSINYLKDSGYGFFLMPTNLFNDKNIKVLVNYLNE